MYLTQFAFPDGEREASFLMGIRRTCYDSFYPFQVLPKKALKFLEFEPITILYGGNGSGKTTVLNVMGEALKLTRDTLYNRTSFFEDYTKMCDWRLSEALPEASRIITSDDVFDFMLNLRTLNQGIDQKREELFSEYLEAKYSQFQMKSLADYDQLKKVNTARRKTQSRFVRESLMDNVREHSNGESAFLYFTSKINDSGLYLLDEPENSLSPEKQQELARFLGDSARFFGCQLVIATHSPFLLAMKGARIYDMDESPADIKPWTELVNVRAYYDFFKEHEKEFQKTSFSGL